MTSRNTPQIADSYTPRQSNLRCGGPPRTQATASTSRRSEETRWCVEPERQRRACRARLNPRRRSLHLVAAELDDAVADASAPTARAGAPASARRSSRAATARFAASRRSSRPVNSSSRSPGAVARAQGELAQLAVLPRHLGDQRAPRRPAPPGSRAGRRRGAAPRAEVERERPPRAVVAQPERARDRAVSPARASSAASTPAQPSAWPPSACQLTSGGREAAVRSRLEERGGRARVGEAPGAPAVVAADDRGADGRVDAAPG